ncbi:MAG: hypothetical protein C5617_007940 [ANME-2 cluster archaeon]|jgi:hypothetical protein|nr:MAG: hypothetical protein C5617_007940 [ANME-2 cluster archaeon]
MNDQSYDETRLDETPTADIINVSYCIGRMEVPIRRGTCPSFQSAGSLPEHGSIWLGQEYDDYQEMRS